MTYPVIYLAAASPDKSVNLIALFQQQLGKVGTVLTCYASDKASFHFSWGKRCIFK
jgi:hypothetical protein